MITRRITRVLRGIGALHVMVLIFILGFIAAAPPWAHADIPRYINYQGKLTDADDNPVTGEVSISIRMYDAATGGTALWTETQTATVTRGIFSILLGETTALDDLDFNDPYWYSVEVEDDGEMTPRQRLTTIAYAINADKLDGYDAADFLRVDASEGTTTGITVTGGLITAGANEDITLDPTGLGNIVMKIDSTSGDFKITDGTTNWVLVDNETGNVTIAKNLTVNGIIYGTLASTGGDSTFSSIVVTGASDLRGNISNSTGAVTIADALTQTGAANQVTFAGNVDANSGMDVTGALTVSGATTLSSALDMNSNIDLDYSGTSPALDVTQGSTGAAAQFSGGRVIVGANETTNTNALSTGELYVLGDLEVDGTIYGNVTSSGTTSLGDTTLSSLVVSGTSDLQGNVDAGAGIDITGVVNFAGGTTYNVDATGQATFRALNVTETDLSTSGTATNTIIQPTFQDGGTDSATTAIAMNVAPTVNYTGSSKTGSYTALKITATETSLPTGSNYLIDAYAGDGTSQKFYVDNSGNVKIFGTLNMSGGRITNLTENYGTLTDTDAVPKSYVDSITPATAGGWTDGGTGVYLLTSTDNVGIGTTSTGTYKFNVDGSANITSLYINGTQITSTASDLNDIVIKSPTSTQTITAGGTGVTPLILKGTISQTASLLEVQDSAALSHLTVEPDGDVQIDTSGAAALSSITQTDASASLAIATDTSQANQGAGADSDGVLKLGINEGNYQYIWYDTNGGTDNNGAFIFSDQTVIPSSSPAYLSFGANADNTLLYSFKLDPDATPKTLSIVEVDRTTTPPTEKSLFQFMADGSFGVFDPTTGEKTFSIDEGRKWTQEFENFIFNGSFEGFSRGAEQTNVASTETMMYSIADGWLNYQGAEVYRRFAPSFGATNAPDVKFGYSSIVVKDINNTVAQGIQQEIDPFRLRQLIGQTVTLSLFARNAGTGTMDISLAYDALDSTGATLTTNGSNFKHNLSINDANFTLLHFTFTVPTATYKLYTRLYGAEADNVANVGSVIYDGVALTRGAIIMPFKPTTIVDTGFQTIYGDLEIASSGMMEDEMNFGVSPGGHLTIHRNLFVGGDIESKGGSIKVGEIGSIRELEAFPEPRGDKIYCYKITAITDTGESLPSEIFIPDGPATLDSSKFIRLHWNCDVPGATFRIYGRSPEFFKPIWNLAGTVVGTGGTSAYSYKVTMAKDTNESPATSIDVYDAPGTLSSTNYVKLTWETEFTGCSFKIYRRINDGTYRLLEETAVDVYSYIDDGTPAPGTGQPPTPNFGLLVDNYTNNYYKDMGTATVNPNIQPPFIDVPRGSILLEKNLIMQSGKIITTGGNNLILQPDWGAFTSVGDPGATVPDHLTSGKMKSLFIVKDLEVDGRIYADGGLVQSGTTTLTGQTTVTVNNDTYALRVTQDGTGDILQLWDGTSQIFRVADGGQTTFTGNIDANAGLDVAGNITVTGTVDGIDLSSDSWVTSQKIADATIAAVDIAAGAVLRAKLNELRPHTNTPTNTIYVEAGTVTVLSNTAKSFAGGATGAFDPIVTTGNSRIDLVTIDSTPALGIVKGTEAVSPAVPSYPTDKVVIAEVVIDELTTAVIDSTEITDVRPFLSLGGGSGMSSITGTTSETFTIGDNVDADKVLAFEEGATDQTLTWNDTSARFDLSNSLSIPTGKQYMVNGVQISSSNLSDVSSIAMLDEGEIVTGGWTFNTANTTFTTAIDVNTASTIAGLNIDGTGVLKMAGTTIIDASRNMSSIGTISSTGSHTLDGDLAFTGPQAITTSTGDLTLNPAGNIAIGAKTISGTTAVIDFSNFDVSSSGAVSAASTITSAGGAIMDSAAATNNAMVDSPTVTLRGSYDADATAGVTATDYDATFTHNLTVAGASPASQLEIDIGGGGAELTLTSAGNLTVTGTINNQTIGATSSLAIINASGDLTVNQNTGVADDIYFAIQHNSGNIFTVDKDGDLYVGGNLQVEGTQTILNVETIEVESSAIKMNRNVTGSPVLNASIVIERGTSADTSLRWNETSDIWDLTADGTNYYGILHTNTDLAGDVSGKYNNLQLGADVVGAAELASTAIQLGDIEAGDLPADGYAATYVNTSGNETMSGSLTAASFTFDNSTLNAEQWSTTAGDITFAPAGLNILPSADGTIDLGLQAAIEALSAASRDVGTGTLTLTSSGAFTTYVDNNLTYRAEIDGAGDAGVATYKWSRDGGSTWVQTGIVTPTTATELENGFKIAFGGLGGVVGDYWDVTITKNTGYKNLFANTITTDNVYTPSIRAENTGGTVVLTGNFEITGDFTAQGSQTIVGGTTYDGAQVIDVTAAEALLVRKDGDTGDVLIADTTNSQVEIYNQLGIGKVPASGIELDVLGDGVFSGSLASVGLNAGSGLITTSGNIQTTVIGVMTSAGLLTASSGISVSGGNIAITDNSNIILNTNKITLYGASGNATMAGTITQLRSIGLTPDYDNATLRGDGSDNFGTLSLKYDNTHNYYEWTTNEPTTQDYDIVLRYRLPDGFSSFDATTPIKLFNKVSDATGNTAITVTMLDTAGASVTLTGGSNLKNTSWAESTITISGSPTLTPGGYVTIIIKLSADQGDTVNAGELTLKGNW